MCIQKDKLIIMQQKNINKLLFILIIICLPTINLFANAGFDDEVTDVPIDGGISVLLAAGVGYGIKKMKRNNKNEA